MSDARWTTTPSELKVRLQHQRAGRPFVELRAADGELHFHVLPDAGKLSIGRDDDADLSLPFDPEVSRLHAELTRIGRYWVISDDGLSRNGTYVNGAIVAGRQRLRDGDSIELGATVIVYRDPTSAPAAGTAPPEPRLSRPTVSEAQRRVVVALCRPFASGERALPATNQAIADELHLSVSAVKAHLRSLFGLFGLDRVPQNEKRVQLAAAALRSGIVAPRDLDR